MTTPTQAQIEAADILHELKVREPCMIDMDGVRPARSDRPQYIILDVKERDEIIAALTAAAGADIRFKEFGNGATWVDFPMTQDSAPPVNVYNSVYQEAIERCAQEAERYDEVGAVIAAAIRAMKDKP